MMALGMPVRWARTMAVLALCGALAGCFQRQAAPLARFEPEAFSAAAGFSRFYETSPDLACEAARRTLLSQGYVIGSASGEQVTGRKFFQPNRETQIQLTFSLSCLAEGDGSVVFANVRQLREELKAGSASTGLSVTGIGSLSLPFGGNNESLVKVGEETVTDAEFYGRFFALMQTFIR